LAFPKRKNPPAVVTEYSSITDRGGGSDLPDLSGSAAKRNPVKHQTRSLLADKRMQRLFDINNIPEVHKKYSKIVKLKEEFQEIKQQFAMPV